jgi:murein lipoprotein
VAGTAPVVVEFGSVRRAPDAFFAPHQTREEVEMHVSKILLAGAAASALLLSGCATTSQLDEVKGMAMKAQQTADMAMQKADAANQCCKANTEKLDRMFKKSMYK